MKKRRWVFALFKSILFRTDLWVTLGDFTLKTQNWEGKSVFDQKSIKCKRNVMCGRQSRLYVSPMCKRIFRFEHSWSIYWQNINFSWNCPKFHIFAKIIIFKYNWTFLDQLLLPYKFYGSDMWRIPSFIFASREPLSLLSWVFNHVTNRVCHIWCNFYPDCMYQTAVIFGTLKDGSLEINSLALKNYFSYKSLPKWRQRFVKNGFNPPFFQKAQNFVLFGSYNFVQISPACGPNTYQIMYGETLNFQCQH